MGAEPAQYFKYTHSRRIHDDQADDVMPDGVNRRTLYPPIAPYSTGTLRVDALHELYFEESGNPRGKPVVFLHGGPGAGANAAVRRFFDPQRYRIVVFDQRGSGRSRPLNRTG